MIESLAKLYAQTELASIKRDAYSSEGKTAQERVAIFLDLMETVKAIQSNFPEKERLRRQRIAEQLDRLPQFWWHNFRKEALAEYQCQNSSK
jgi:hypothetical protein